MRTAAFVKGCAVCLSVCTICCLGCAHTMSSESTMIREASCQAELDDCQAVRLASYYVQDRDEGGPAVPYEQLVLELRPLPDLESSTVLKRIELGAGVRRGQFELADVEVRADESRRRVWFVDRSVGRVIASVDRETGETTGPDDAAPTWATVDGGVVLREAD
jgi:hypothetical protein